MAKEEEQKPKEHQEKQKAQAQSIVRIAGRDIDGDLNIQDALMQIKGVGYNLASALAISIRDMYNIPKSTTIGSLDEEGIEKIEGLLKDPKQAKIPLYLLNRRNDRETGENLHLVGTDLIVKVKQDIDNDIKIQSWRGFRHRWGQKVRGQKTRSTGRTGATVGVTKKAAEEAQKAAKAPAKSAGAGGGGGSAAAPAAEAKK
ncbi:MAG: 30S ribosomal protein S13 [Candidatus Micrarchaeaceae archaeon]